MTAIQEFYKEKNVLLTGGTGFLGLTLVEKLLRSFPDAGDIYMVVRCRKNETFEARREKFLTHAVFNRIKTENPSKQRQEEIFARVKWIEGELGRPNLGIPSHVLTMLQGVVNIVIHCAAAINFNIPLKGYIDKNLRSTEDLLIFSSGCKNFQCFMYMSTAYCQVRKSRHYITEDILLHPTDPRQLLKMAAAMTNEEMEVAAPELVTDWVNYYAYCKNAAENLCLAYEKQFGIVVYRPGVVVHSIAEPAPYWIGNKLGFPRSLMEANRGLVLFSDPDVNANAVPVDYTVNAALATIYRTAIDKTLKVYNFTANNHYVSLGTAFHYYSNNVPNYEKKLVPRRYELMTMRNVQAGSIEERLIKEIQGYYYFEKMVEYFMWNKLNFHNDNIEMLWSDMTDEERQLLPCDVRTINWRQFFSNMSANEFGTQKISFDL